MIGATGPSNSSLVCGDGSRYHVHYYENTTEVNDAALETVVPEWCKYEQMRKSTGPPTKGYGK